MSQNQGRFQSIYGFMLLVVYHPMYMIFEPNLKINLHLYGTSTSLPEQLTENLLFDQLT